MHPVFHVSLLRKYEDRNGYKPLPPPLEVLDEDSVYEVDEVLAHKIVCQLGRLKTRRNVELRLNT
jgi:hypothetical protein